MVGFWPQTHRFPVQSVAVRGAKEMGMNSDRILVQAGVFRGAKEVGFWPQTDRFLVLSGAFR